MKNIFCGDCIVECDNCGEEIEIEGETDYEDINCCLRSNGWVPTNIDGEFVDFCCEECREEYRRKNSLNSDFGKRY